MMHVFVRNLFIGLTLMAASTALAADNAKNTKKPPTSAPSAPANSPLNGVAQAAVKSGVTTCAARINQVINFLTAGNQSSAFSFIPQGNANNVLISYSLEVQSNNVVSYISANFAPVGSEGCGASYEAITHWNNSCTDVANKGFAGTKPINAIQKNIQILQGDGTMRVFLIPTGQGCISVKKEVIS